jgi:hypothetical protein
LVCLIAEGERKERPLAAVDCLLAVSVLNHNLTLQSRNVCDFASTRCGDLHHGERLPCLWRQGVPWDVCCQGAPAPREDHGRTKGGSLPCCQRRWQAT